MYKIGKSNNRIVISSNSINTPSTGLKLNAAYLILGLSGTDSIISFALCLPAILKSIPMGIGWTSFTLAATSLAHCATVIPFGNLADRLGRRKIFMLGHLCTSIGGKYSF